jgi:predicted polyphosphate/ATP-dependent NAD kinase
LKTAEKTLGFIVNPVAGMGGAVGLKGTDGETTIRKAMSLGAKPIAHTRAELLLSRLSILKGRVRIVAGAGMMGECEAKNVGFNCVPVGGRKEETTAEDTKIAAKVMMEAGVDLLIFCGGDGTARDIMDTIDVRVPALGVPTGVKMHSAVFAVDPESAARITIDFLEGTLLLREAEVMDVDEEEFRHGRLSARLYGYLLVPYEPMLIQVMKVASPVTEDEVRDQAAIAVYIIEEVLEPGVIYILGPGTTTRTLADLLNEKKTLLGVDLLRDKRILMQDVNEREILKTIRGKKAKIIVTPIGGQGFIFGRGNQQISPAVIKEVGIENIMVIATKHKLVGLKSLKVDTGDLDLNQGLKGQIKVITDYREETLMSVE